MKKIFYVEPDSTYFISNRLELACSMLNDGYEVHVATMLFSNEDKQVIESKGIVCHFPTGENQSMKCICKKIKKVSPNIIHVCNLSACAKLGLSLLGYKRSNIVFSITGLGYAYTSNSLFAKMIRIMLKFLIPALNAKHDMKFIFQNEDNKKEFVGIHKLKENQIFLIMGSGVNLEKFSPFATNNEIPKVLFAGRLLKDKGIYEYIEAAKIIHERNISAIFMIAGTLDKKNPNSLSESELTAIKKIPFVEYNGYVKNMNVLFREVNIACLPSSYGEGLSKFLIEAGASGKPIVTTDVPGCREVVENGKNGFVVPAKDAKALSEAIATLCLDKEKRESMGKESRRVIEEHFAMGIVVKKIKDVYKKFC